MSYRRRKKKPIVHTAVTHSPTCPLCQSNSQLFYQFKTRIYHQCNTCKAILLDPSLMLYGDDEKSRYEEHNNDVEDPRFQQFAESITSQVLQNFTKEHQGLDFGAGVAPVITKVLQDHNYQITPYDPYFHKHQEALNKTYDYITCCEVIEHFHNPKKEFLLLNSLLKTGGKLYCKTDFYHEDLDFHKWYYKNDHTHVFIFHEETVGWVQKNLGFQDAVIEGRLITFTK